MIADADIEHFLFMSAHSLPSVEALRPKFRRWRRQLEARGWIKVQDLHSQEAGEFEVINYLTLLALQASSTRAASPEHRLRNLTGVRPYKP